MSMSLREQQQWMSRIPTIHSVAALKSGRESSLLSSSSVSVCLIYTEVHLAMSLRRNTSGRVWCVRVCRCLILCEKYCFTVYTDSKLSLISVQIEGTCLWLDGTFLVRRRDHLIGAQRAPGNTRPNATEFPVS